MDEKKEKEIEEVNESESLAVEMIRELKVNAKRWFIAFIITLIFLVGTNMAWLYVFQSYDYVSVDSKEGNANYIGNDGEVNNYGVGEGQKEEERKVQGD